MNKAQQKEEALRTQRLLSLPAQMQAAFAKDGSLYVSKPAASGHALELSPATPAEQAMADRFAAETGNLPYHISYDPMEKVSLYTLYFVRRHKLPWQKSTRPIPCRPDFGFEMPAYLLYCAPNPDRSQPIRSVSRREASACVLAGFGGLYLVGIMERRKKGRAEH